MYGSQASNLMYQKVHATGLLGKQLDAIAKLITDYNAPATANELIQFAKETEHDCLSKFRDPLHINKHFKQLERMEVIKSGGLRTCKATSNTSEEWIFNDGNIVAVEKKATPLPLLKELNTAVMNHLIQDNEQSRSELMAVNDKISIYLRDRG